MKLEGDNNTQEPTEGEPKPTVDTGSTEFTAAVSAAVTEATAGLKKNRDDVLAEKRDLMDKHQALLTQLADLGDLETVKAMVNRFQNDEEAKLIADGKIDQVLNQRTDAMRRDAETRVTAATERVTELEGQLGSARSTIASLVIDGRIADAAGKLSCVPSAIADIQRAARDLFSINENSEPEARDADGVLRMGPDGKANLTPAAWLEQQKDSSPHWWGASAGGGAGGGTNVRGKGAMDAKKLDNMTGPQKIAAAMRGGA